MLNAKEVIRVANNIASMKSSPPDVTLRQLLCQSIILIILCDAGEDGMSRDELEKRASAAYCDLMEIKKAEA